MGMIEAAARLDSLSHAAHMLPDCYATTRPGSRADFNFDDDVDLTNFEMFGACYTGPNIGPPAACCANADPNVPPRLRPAITPT